MALLLLVTNKNLCREIMTGFNTLFLSRVCLIFFYINVEGNSTVRKLGTRHK